MIKSTSKFFHQQEIGDYATITSDNGDGIFTYRAEFPNGRTFAYRDEDLDYFYTNTQKIIDSKDFRDLLNLLS